MSSFRGMHVAVGDRSDGFRFASVVVAFQRRSVALLRIGCCDERFSPLGVKGSATSCINKCNDV